MHDQDVSVDQRRDASVTYLAGLDPTRLLLYVTFTSTYGVNDGKETDKMNAQNNLFYVWKRFFIKVIFKCSKVHRSYSDNRRTGKYTNSSTCVHRMTLAWSETLTFDLLALKTFSVHLCPKMHWREVWRTCIHQQISRKHFGPTHGLTDGQHKFIIP